MPAIKSIPNTSSGFFFGLTRLRFEEETCRGRRAKDETGGGVFVESSRATRIEEFSGRQAILCLMLVILTPMVNKQPPA